MFYFHKFSQHPFLNETPFSQKRQSVILYWTRFKYWKKRMLLWRIKKQKMMLRYIGISFFSVLDKNPWFFELYKLRNYTNFVNHMIFLFNLSTNHHPIFRLLKLVISFKNMLVWNSDFMILNLFHVSIKLLQ